MHCFAKFILANSAVFSDEVNNFRLTLDHHLCMIMELDVNDFIAQSEDVSFLCANPFPHVNDFFGFVVNFLASRADIKYVLLEIL